MPVSITLIASHALTGDELGHVGLVLWFISIGALLGASWAAWLVPQIARRPSPSAADGVKEGLILASAGGAIAAGVAVAARLPAPLALVCAVGAAALGSVRVLAAVFQGREAYVRLAQAYGAGLLAVVAALAAALTLSATAVTLSASYVAGLLAAVGLAYLMSGAIVARGLPAAALRGAVKSWSLILVLSIVDAILWQRSELFFLHVFRSDREVGQYAAAHAVVATVGLPATATAGVILPRLARAIGDVETAGLTYGRMWLAASIAFPTLLWAATLAAPLLVGRAGSEMLPSPATLCAILAMGAGPAASGVVASSAFYAAGLIRPMVVVGGLGALANVALDLLLIPTLGLLGAAVATASVQFGVACVGFFIAARELQVEAGMAEMAVLALGAGMLGDLALVLTFNERAQGGLIAGAAATLLMAAVTMRLIWEVRRQA